MRVFGVVGWKNSGKTDLMVRLISRFTADGLSVSTIKHAHHSLAFQTADEAGHDVMPANVGESVFASSSRWAQLRQAEGEDGLADLLERLEPVDLVLVEGYKFEGHPKLEAYRPESRRDPIARNDPSILALATTMKPDGQSVPVFDLGDTAGISRFILDHVGLQ